MGCKFNGSYTEPSRISTIYYYCDLKPEDRNSEDKRKRPLLDNGSLNKFPRQWIC
jgi:hypothetical protein